MFPTPGQYSREANARIDAHASDARTRRIEAFELLWAGNAYDARPSFWDNRVPLRERKPAVQSGILRASGQRLAHMVFGDRAFPSVAVQGQAFGVALDDADVDALSALIAETITLAKLKTAMRGYLLEGLKTGTSVALCELRAGKPAVRILPAKWCTARFDEGGRITHLVIQYRHRVGETERWYRREIGDGVDLVRAEVDVSDDGREPEWSTVPAQSTRPITFVPAVWTRYGCESVEDGHAADGHPLCEGVEDELLALDMELSQLYRNALYNGEPQMVRVGVSSGDPMTSAGGMGNAGRTAADGAGAFSWLNSKLPGWVFGGGPSTVARKGPGQVWDLPTGGDAKLLESSGSGAQIIKGAVEEYRRIVTDSMGVVIADPQTLGKGDLSARALTLMFGPMLDTASAIRVDYGEALVSILDALLRLMAEHATGVYVATLDAARNALAKMRRATEGGGVAWIATPLTLTWGEFFEPSWSDVSAAIDAASKATGGRAVLSQRAAMRLVAPVVGVDDLDAESEALEQELGGDTAAMRDALGALAPKSDAAAPVEAVQDTALNGAQVEALVSLAEKVTARMIPLESAVRIAMRGFQLAEADAREMLAPAAEMSPAVPQSVPAPVAPEVKS